MTARGDDRSAPAPLAYLLAPIAGYVDAVGFIMLAGVFVANMSGNTVRFAVDVGQGEWGDAATRGVPIVVFVVAVGLTIGTVSVVGRRLARVSLTPLLAIELLLLTALLVLGTFAFDGQATAGGSRRFYVLIVLAVAAMACQTVGLRRVAGVPVQTTFITNMLVYLGEETAEALAGWRTARGAEARRRLRIHGGVWFAYLLGGGIGAFGAERLEYVALGVPLALLVVVLVVARMRGLPEVTAA